MVKSIPVMPLRHPSTTRMYKIDFNCVENICETPVNVVGTDIMNFLRMDQRQVLNIDNRWALFDKKSEKCVTAGSVLKVTYYSSFNIY